MNVMRTDLDNLERLCDLWRLHGEAATGECYDNLILSNAVPSLVAEVRRLRREVEVMRQALEVADAAMCHATFAGGVDRRAMNDAIDTCRKALARVVEPRNNTEGAGATTKITQE